MTAKAVVNPRFRVVDTSGNSLNGGLVYTYEPGTTTAKTTYSDPDLATPNANPVVLDSKGECHLYYEGLCRLRVTTSAGVLVQDDDDVAADPQASETWINSLSATYVSSSSFTLDGDQTTEYHANRRIRLTDSSTLYGEISSSSYSAPNTTVNVTLDSGSLSASLSAAAISIITYSNTPIPELNNQSLVDPVITGASLSDYSEVMQSHGNTGATETIDLENGNVHRITLDNNCTLTFSNPPATGNAGSFTLIITQDGTGSRTITWPASVDWPSAAAPTLSTGAGDVDIISFLTTDGGTIWYGVVGGYNFS